MNIRRWWWTRPRPRIYTQDTQVGAYQVPVKRARYLTLGTATGGAHGKKEAGDYAFWTAVLKEPRYCDLNTGSLKRTTKVTARALAWLPAGDRFYRMSVEMVTIDSAYRTLWEGVLGQGRNIAYIRPATVHEVRRWAMTHLDDKKRLKMRRHP
mgnify:FL=1